MTGSNLLIYAGIALGELSPGENFNTSEQTYCLNKLNSIIDNANIQEEMATSAVVATKAMVSGTNSYALSTRVSRVVSASIIVSSNLTYPVEIIDAVAWNLIEDRDAVSSIPNKLWYDCGYPTGTVYLSPTPSGGTLSYTAWASQSTFATVGTDNTLLPGYELWLVTQLAIEIAPFFQRDIPASLMKSNSKAQNEIRKLNAALWGKVPTAEGGGVAA